MPPVSFSKRGFKKKVKLGIKTQTIRRETVRWKKLKVGDSLKLFWKMRTPQCEKLGTGICTKIIRIRFKKVAYHKQLFLLMQNTEELSFYSNNDKEIIARRDGFKDADEMFRWFHKTHREEMFKGIFRIIRWKLKR